MTHQEYMKGYNNFLKVKSILESGNFPALVYNRSFKKPFKFYKQNAINKEDENMADFRIENGVLKRYKGISENVVIPATYRGEPVTSIGDGAFSGCRNLTSITIPDSVTSIGSGAFYNCWCLTSITIPDGVTAIGGCTFHDCNKLASITIPDSVTSIGDGAFQNCDRLRSITIGDGVTHIGEWAFEYIKIKSPVANYKAFAITPDGSLRCQSYTFVENKWSDKVENPQPYKRGYHFCTNLFDIFNHYYGTIDRDIAIYECEVGQKVLQGDSGSTYVTDQIKPVKRIYCKDVIEILNSGK